MIEYKFIATLSVGEPLSFVVCANNEKQAKGFGLATTRNILKQKGKSAKIVGISAEEI